MEAINNERLREIKLSIYINHIDKTKDKNEYKKLLKILSCLALSFDGESNRILANITQISICDGYAKATDKELIATCKTFFSDRQASKRMGITPNTFINRYKDFSSRNFITNDFLESLKPIFNTPKEREVINIMLDFIDHFRLPSSSNNHDLNDKERTLELEFWIIYNRLFDVLRNDAIIGKFIFNLCNAFDIDYGTIANLKNNIHIIGRIFPKFRYNNLYLMQELYTLYTYKGYSKGKISTEVLGKHSNYLHSTGGKKYAKLIEKEDMKWQYAPTIKWDNMDKVSVKKFIQLLHDFVDYGI